MISRGCGSLSHRSMVLQSARWAHHCVLLPRGCQAQKVVLQRGPGEPAALSYLTYHTTFPLHPLCHQHLQTSPGLPDPGLWAKITLLSSQVSCLRYSDVFMETWHWPRTLGLTGPHTPEARCSSSTQFLNPFISLLLKLLWVEIFLSLITKYTDLYTPLHSSLWEAHGPAIFNHIFNDKTLLFIKIS